MKVVEVTPRPVDRSEYYRRFPTEDEVPGDPIVGPTTVVDADTGEQLLVYAPAGAADLGPLLSAVQNIAITPNPRANGTVAQSRTFGSDPRSPYYGRDCCHAASMAAEYPAEHSTLCDYGLALEGTYRRLGPDRYGAQQAQAAAILPEWRLSEDSVFTGGIVNRTTAYAWHTDGGNFSGAWSMMLCLRNKVVGGHLAIPGLGVKLACEDGYLALFDGQKLLHGVTPLRRVGRGAYRYTIVWYGLKNLSKCLPVGEELALGRRTRTEREERRAVADRG